MEETQEENMEVAQEESMDEKNRQPEIISDLGAKIKRIEEAVDKLKPDISEAKRLIECLKDKMPIKSNAMIDEKLTASAKYSIDACKKQFSYDELVKFLMEHVFGKPRGGVLPIVRRYTDDVEAMINVLGQIRNSIEVHHEEYMKEQKRLDDNLKKRINKLVENIIKEYEAEVRSNKRQTNLDEYFPNKKSNVNPGKKVNEIDSSASGNAIPGVSGYGSIQVKIEPTEQTGAIPVQDIERSGEQTGVILGQNAPISPFQSEESRESSEEP